MAKVHVLSKLALTGVLLLLLNIQYSASVPVHPAQLLSVQRSPTYADVIRPASCPTACKELFHALDAVTDDGRCACICPAERPIYLTTVGKCVDELPDCARTVHFASHHKDDFPVISLPSHGGILNKEQPINWTDAGLQVQNGIVNCSVYSVFTDTVEHRWHLVAKNLFRIAVAMNGSVITFVGTPEDSRALRGSVVQIKLQCADFPKEDVCIGFSVIGGSESEKAHQMLVSNHGARTELVLLVILAVLLILTLFGSFFVWNLCWRIKKEKLISEIQMQFLVHIKQQQEEARNAAAMAASISAHQNAFAAVNATSPGDLYPGNSQSEFHAHNNQMGDRQIVGGPKRRLFFSTEFFDPHLMHNPPPIAEQFLFDLRRMIDMAKERIRLKRHMPQLECVAEEEVTTSVGESGRKTPVVDTVDDALHEKDDHRVAQFSQDSPRSGKSVDSGHDTLEGGSESSESKDSEESSSDEEHNKKRERNESEENSTETSDGQTPPVRKLVDGFESKINRTPSISRIPKLSPKVPPRSLSVARPPPSPGSPTVSGIPQPMAAMSPYTQRKTMTLTSPPASTSTSPPPAPPSAYKRTKNKGYAVFPADTMLKKSLPRRPKREIPRLGMEN